MAMIHEYTTKMSMSKDRKDKQHTYRTISSEIYQRKQCKKSKRNVMLSQVFPICIY